MEDRFKYKYPFISSEILGVGNEKISEYLFKL